jgi:hypothetical protein
MKEPLFGVHIVSFKRGKTIFEEFKRLVSETNRQIPTPGSVGTVVRRRHIKSDQGTRTAADLFQIRLCSKMKRCVRNVERG